MIPERLKKLRAEMAKRDIAIYIVPTADFHESEYVGEYFTARKYMTGFTGSAGVANIGTSTGTIKEVIGINEDLQGRTVIIVEDIVESGLTIKRMMETLGTRGPKSIHVCTLLLKPERLKVDLDIEYAAMEIPNDFIVGYGLDYDQQGRGLRDIYTVVED